MYSCLTPYAHTCSGPRRLCSLPSPPPSCSTSGAWPSTARWTSSTIKPPTNLKGSAFSTLCLHELVQEVIFPKWARIAHSFLLGGEGAGGLVVNQDRFDPYMYGVAAAIARTPLFWVGALVVPLMAMLLDSFKAYLIRNNTNT